MIIILKPNPEQKQLENLMLWLESMDLEIHRNDGMNTIILGLVGDTSEVDMDLISSLDIVDSVKRVTEPYKKVNRKFHPDDTIVDVGGRKIGGGHFQIIAGPCSVESK